ncbi:UDP-4-amino-4,6-dideoxy-N-acetyl-beta-L-altrosamine transaminase [Thiosocius teredinicola]|uniref:UDP-4-amino-4, 6-dideoxy-N-acetyl-beta-L-altrosamine transaminase n=1 Tax=Thiosocius teredinicola TaxID=1973002 RepID=UPI000991390B
MIPYGRQDVDENDIEAVVDVLRSDWLTQGPVVPMFEQAIADYCCARRAVAVSSGTAGLHLAYLAAGLGPGSLLWTSPITFVASANAALYCGAEVDFVDVEADTANMSVQALEAKLEAAERNGRLPDVVVPVHFAGLPCDLESIDELAQRFGFTVIEDASHALGARYCSRPVGNGRFADMAVFSFHPVKNITTGEGGIVTTNDDALAERMTRLRSHGIEKTPPLLSDDNAGGWYYEQQALGFNYRLTDMQAALGLSQLQRLDQFIEDRARLVKRYDEAFADCALRVVGSPSDALSTAHHLYVVRVDGGEAVRRQLYDHLHANEVMAQVHYIPVHLQPYYRDKGFGPGDFPHAEAYYAGALSLPLFPTLTDEQQDKVIRLVKQIV